MHFRFAFLLPLAIGLCLRSAVSLLPYSGQGRPPMFGDFEAQRHWMEVTVNLPITHWYQNSSDNDLNYWGLDYPPVTAYHSFVLGKIAEWIDGSWVALHSSRGIETSEHKLFMRYSVLISDLLTFMPIAVFFAYMASNQLTSKAQMSPLSVATIFLTFPGLILIDHGHFQFNCVSLGLYLLAVSLMFCDYDLLGSVTFCLALSYKQMELYHALSFFFYLLGRYLCRERLLHLIILVLAVISTLALVLSPFLFSFENLRQVGIRMFPITRGLFEDKVANFWCVSSIFIKWKQVLPTSTLFVCCFLSTIATSLPACFLLFCRPSKTNLAVTQSLVSLSFFLFSYQVHEKSILLCAVPVLCLLPIFPLSSIYFCLVATLSMWPLLVKDQLSAACLSLSAVFYVANSVCLATDNFPGKRINLAYFWPLSASVIGFLVIFAIQSIIQPPEQLPFIFPLAVNVLSFAHFVGFFGFWYWHLFNMPTQI